MLVIKGDIKRHIVTIFGDKPSPVPTAPSTEVLEPSSIIDIPSAVQQYFDEHPDATNTQCAQDLNINRSTVSKYHSKKR